MINVQNLNLQINDTNILSDISFKIDGTNGVVGLIGPNGAGKTSLISCLIGLRKASSGSIKIFANTIGYCCDVPDLPRYLTASEAIEYTALLRNEKMNKNQIAELLSLVSLNKTKNKLIGDFSLGMKQRLGIACSLVGNPDLVFLDEPTSALDPFGRAEILDLVLQLGATSTVIVSSHLLNDIENISNSLLVLDKGKLLYTGNKDDFVNTYKSSRLCIRISPETREVDVQSFKDNLEITNIDYQWNHKEPYEIYFDAEQQHEIFALLSKSDSIMVLDIIRSDHSLYNAFKSVLGAKDAV